MMMLIYLPPYMASTTATGINDRALAFSLSGIAGIVGIWLGGIGTIVSSMLFGAFGPPGPRPYRSCSP